MSDDFDFSSDDAARESMKRFIRNHFPEEIEGLEHLFEDPDWYESLRDELGDRIEASKKELPRNIKKLLRLLNK